MKNTEKYETLVTLIQELDSEEAFFNAYIAEIGPKSRFDMRYAPEVDITMWRSPRRGFDSYYHKETGLSVFAAQAFRPNKWITDELRRKAGKKCTDQFLAQTSTEGCTYRDAIDAWISVVLCEIRLSILGRMGRSHEHNPAWLKLIQDIRKGSDGRVVDVGYHSSCSSTGLESIGGHEVEPTLEALSEEVCKVAQLNPLYHIRFIEEEVPSVVKILDEIEKNEAEREYRQRREREQQIAKEKLAAKAADEKRRKLLSEDRKDAELPTYSWYYLEDEKLEELLWKHPMTEIAVMCRVTETAVRNRVKERNLNKPPRGHIWKLKAQKKQAKKRQVSHSSATE